MPDLPNVARPKFEDPAAQRFFDGMVVALQAVIKLLRDYASPPPWVDLQLKTGWTLLGTTYNKPQARWKPGRKTVVFRGSLIGPAAISEITNVPADMKPLKNEILHAGGAAGYCRVDVRADGSVALVAGTAVGYLSLDGLSYEVG